MHKPYSPNLPLALTPSDIYKAFELAAAQAVDPVLGSSFVGIVFKITAVFAASLGLPMISSKDNAVTSCTWG